MDKYKKIVLMTGEYQYRNYTVKDIIDLKGKKILSQTLPFSPSEAEAAQEAGIDLMNSRFNYSNSELAIKIRQAAPNTFMSFVIPLLSVPTEVNEEAVTPVPSVLLLNTDEPLILY